MQVKADQLGEDLSPQQLQERTVKKVSEVHQENGNVTATTNVKEAIKTG